VLAVFGPTACPGRGRQPNLLQVVTHIGRRLPRANQREPPALPAETSGQRSRSSSSPSPYTSFPESSPGLELCEHVFVTAEGHPYSRFRRAIERRALWAAEDAARELPDISLEDALALVHLYADRRSPKYERAALRWLERYLVEATPRLRNVAEIASALSRRDPDADGEA
jgi:hypothetical protein